VRAEQGQDCATVRIAECIEGILPRNTWATHGSTDFDGS